MNIEKLLQKKEYDLVSEFKSKLKEKFSKDFENIIVYGSKSRGDSNEDSDLDLILVLNTENRLDEIQELLFDLEIKHDFYIVSLITYTKKEFKNQSNNNLNLFFKNIKREGISIWI